MEPRDWTIALIEPNKFEAQIINDLLRAAGVQRIRRFASSQDALTGLELYPANLILMEIESASLGGVDWTKKFRRSGAVNNRKAPVLLMSHAVSRALAEECRHAGANAIIGKPISGSALLTTIKKVLAAPRPFVDAENYVGPCRRAGIVTANMSTRRRKADAAQGAQTLPDLIGALENDAHALAEGRAKRVDACETSLRHVQMLAMAGGDGPLMRACATFALLLATKGADPAEWRVAVLASAKGLVDISKAPLTQNAQRDALAEGVRDAVTAISQRRAA